LTATTPAVDLRLFKDKTFMSATLIGAVQFAILMANLFLLPVFMQEMLGYSAIDTGLALLPRAGIMFVVNPIVGKLYSKISLRLLVGNGVVCVSLGSFAMATFTLQTGLSQIILATLVQGVGFSCLFIPLAAAALSNIPKPAWLMRPGSIRSSASSVAPSAWPSSPPCSRATEPSRAPAWPCMSPSCAPK
jgi:DHA2 family multidrug resistance protein